MCFYLQAVMSLGVGAQPLGTGPAAHVPSVETAGGHPGWSPQQLRCLGLNEFKQADPSHVFTASQHCYVNAQSFSGVLVRAFIAMKVYCGRV